MVQRKLPAAKLNIQPQPFSLSHHHDCKSPRGADLKAKKMKKSASKKTTPPPPTLPNYMKSTTSSDARKEQSHSSSAKKSTKAVARTLTKNPTFKPVVVRKRVVCENLDAQRATCSSALKDCKFPAYLALSNGGTESVGPSAIKVCPYSYCSLNGHHHRDPLPPLKCFLSARRRAVETQRSVSDDLKGRDFFVEIYSAGGGGADETVVEDQEERLCDDFDEQNQRNEELLSESTPNDHFYGQDSDGSDMEWETGDWSPLQLDYDDECSHETAVSDDPFVENDSMVNSEGKDCCYDDNLVNEVSRESFNEEGFGSDTPSRSDDGECTALYNDDLQILSNFETSAPLQVLTEEEGAFDEENGECLPNVDETSKTEDVALLQLRAISKKLVEDGDELGDFNPRAPNFLPMEPDPEAEKVDLRHQDLDERKNAEEWMVDYALRQVVTKLGPARKRKVSLLVEAFEKVMPATKWDLQLRHGSTFDQARPIQACSESSSISIWDTQPTPPSLGEHEQQSS